MQYLAIFKKNKSKDKWQLASKAITSLDLANEYKDRIMKLAKDKGFDNAETCIQSFSDKYNIPETIENIKPEKLLLN